MHPVISAQLAEFSTTHTDETLNSAEFFEVFSIYSIENGLMGLNIDPFAARLSDPEFGIDGISIILQGELCTDTDEINSILSVGQNHAIEFHFFQSKTSEHARYGDISKFLDAVVDFFRQGTLSNTGQIEDLRACKDLIYSTSSRRNPSIRCFYCTTGTGETSTTIRDLISTNKARMAELSLFSDIEISVLGANPLQEGYRSATNSISSRFNFPKVVTLPSHPNVEQAFIGLVPATELLNLALLPGDTSEEDRVNRAVFYDNIRDFNPRSEINQTILKELEDGDDNSFVFKNNGVTVVAREISRKGDMFQLEDYQIVNGCQTTNILFLARDKIANVNVPMRLIGSKDPDFVASIIVGTNKQNEVRDDQFWALLPFMKDLEQYCHTQADDKRILIERRENQYRDMKVERTRIFKLADLMKAITAMYLGQPNRAARDYRTVRREFKDEIFQPSHNVELYHLAAMCSYKFDFAVRNRRVDRSRGIYKFYTLFAALNDYWIGSNLLNATTDEQRRVMREVFALLEDEEKWVEHIEKVSAFLDDEISKQDAMTRERVRDYIRTESALSAFREKAYGRE